MIFYVLNSCDLKKRFEPEFLKEVIYLMNVRMIEKQITTNHLLKASNRFRQQIAYWGERFFLVLTYTVQLITFYPEHPMFFPFWHFNTIAIYTNNDTCYHCICGRDEKRKRNQCWQLALSHRTFAEKK